MADFYMLATKMGKFKNLWYLANARGDLTRNAASAAIIKDVDNDVERVRVIMEEVFDVTMGPVLLPQRAIVTPIEMWNEIYNKSGGRDGG